MNVSVKAISQTYMSKTAQRALSRLRGSQPSPNVQPAPPIYLEPRSAADASVPLCLFMPSRTFSNSSNPFTPSTPFKVLGRLPAFSERIRSERIVCHYLVRGRNLPYTFM